MSQLALTYHPRVRTARKLGAVAGDRALAKATEHDEEFAEKAMAFIVSYVRQEGTARGEEITFSAQQAGIRPPPGKDMRCIGPIYQRLLNENKIRIVGDCRRVRGHGSAGGKIYAPGKAAA